jgi:phosphoenolpyruvate-protein phosphotransferase
MLVLKGTGASAGIAAGRVVVRAVGAAPPAEPPPGDRQQEAARFAAALAESRRQLTEIAQAVRRQAGEREAQIFAAHLAMLEDPLLAGAIRAYIERDGLAAGQAVERAVAELAARFLALPDALLRARADDIRDLGARLLRNLRGSADAAPAAGHGGGAILCAEDTTPSEIASLDTEQELGVVTERGAVNSHAAILARALGIPLVIGVSGALSRLRAGALAIVDGASGEVLVEPDQEALARYAGRRQTRTAAAGDDSPAVTLDGFRVELAANIGSVKEAAAALAAGAEAVGVLRTEFLFLDRTAPPSEEEQFQAYAAVLRALAPRRVVIRTADIGGDKEAAYLALPSPQSELRTPHSTFRTGENPALGLRGIRLSLRQEEMFRTQLRALLRAAPFGNLAILLPMVCDVSEVRRARELIAHVHAELQRPDLGPWALDLGRICLGVMVETPAAAVLAAELAEQTDFLSIGTNDLTQYVLAADRTDPAVAEWYQPLHPAVLRLVAATVDAASRAGKWAAVCGEVAADPLAAPLFVGMGVRELSMTPASIPAVKQAIRRWRKADAGVLLSEALKAKEAAKVVELLSRWTGDQAWY